MGLRRRIVLPFVAIFALAFAVTAGVSIYLATRTVERQLQLPARNLARLMGQFGWTSPEMLGRMNAAFGADIMIRDDKGWSSTLPAKDQPDVILKGVIGARSGVFVRPFGADVVVACEPFGSGNVLYLLYPADQLSAEQWRVA